MEQLQSQNKNLMEAFKFWRTAAIFMLIVSVFTTVCCGMIANNVQRVKENLLQCQVELESVKRIRDLAVERVGDLAKNVEDLEAELNTLKSAQAEAQSRDILAGGQYVSLGEFTVSAYCACERCCNQWADGITASGLTAEPGMIAVDPNVISLGSYVMIDGVEYLAADTGGAIKGNRIDVFCEDHQSAVEYGVQSHEVYLVAEEEG